MCYGYYKCTWWTFNDVNAIERCYAIVDCVRMSVLPSVYVVTKCHRRDLEVHIFAYLFANIHQNRQ